MTTGGAPQITWQPSALELDRRAHRRKASGRSVLVALASFLGLRRADSVL